MPVHDRMPVKLYPEGYALWLEEGEREQELLRELLRPCPGDGRPPREHPRQRPGDEGGELVEEAQIYST